MYGCGGQAVGDDDHGVEIARQEQRGGFGIEAAAEVGTAQVDRAITRGAVQSDTQSTHVEPAVHGVTSAGVGQLKIEKRASGEAVPGATESDTRRSQLAQMLPGVFDQHVGQAIRLPDGYLKASSMGPQ